MIMGYGIIAVPTGIVTVELNRGRTTVRRHERCPTCGLEDHDNDANYCKRCGTHLLRGPGRQRPDEPLPGALAEAPGEASR